MKNRKKLIILGYNNIVQRVLIDLNDSYEVFVLSSKHQFEKSVDLNNAQKVIINNPDELIKTLNKYQEKEKIFVISIGCPWILKNSHFESLTLKIFNLHGSHLPLYRGGTIYSWYIMNKRRTGLCAIHYMDEKIDSGAIVGYEEYIIPEGIRKPIDFINLYEDKNSQFLIKFLENWYNDTIELLNIDQPEYLSSYWPRLKAIDHAWINWEWDGEEIDRLVCAFDDPYDGAQTRWKDQIIRIKNVHFQTGNTGFHPFQYGLVFRKNENWFNVAVKNGELLVETIIDKTSKDIYKDIKIGDRLFTLEDDKNNIYKKIISTNTGLKSIKYW